MVRFVSITTTLAVLGLGYSMYSIWTIITLFTSPHCKNERNCLKSYLRNSPDLDICIFFSQKREIRSYSEMQLLETISKFNYTKPWERRINVNIPEKMAKNGVFFFHMFVLPSSSRPLPQRCLTVNQIPDVVSFRIPLTQMHVPDSFIFKLLNNDGNETKKNPPKNTKEQSEAVSHIKAKVTFNMLTDVLLLAKEDIPIELYNILKIVRGDTFLPVLIYNFLETKIEDLRMIKHPVEEVVLKYEPTYFGKLRFVLSMKEALAYLKTMGFSSRDIDDIKSIFADTNLILITLTMIVTTVHILFDFLAFKNDITFWREKSTMEGLSSKLVLWRGFSQTIICLYLHDENASLLVLVPSVIATIIECLEERQELQSEDLSMPPLAPDVLPDHPVYIFKTGKIVTVQDGGDTLVPYWKILKFLRRRYSEETLEAEIETIKYDAECMRYLSYVLYPLCIGGAMYSLFYQPHKSWYSWCINSLVNGVYAFGFLFMLPQLFINYRLKSVDALPWRSLMYKAFNTFIDDFFAFIITMPTSHRVACFRDDIVFLIYLYQRWLYPVDKTKRAGSGEGPEVKSIEQEEKKHGKKDKSE